MFRYSSEMKCTVLAIVVLTLSYTSPALSATWRGMANDKRYPGKCYMENSFLLDYGQEYHPSDRCEQIICSEGGEISGYSCGIKVVGGCTDAGYADVSKNYPECCLKKFICKENGNEKIIYM